MRLKNSKSGKELLIFIAVTRVILILEIIKSNRSLITMHNNLKLSKMRKNRQLIAQVTMQKFYSKSHQKNDAFS
jgi:hypothetical protein